MKYGLWWFSSQEIIQRCPEWLAEPAPRTEDLGISTAFDITYWALKFAWSLMVLQPRDHTTLPRVTCRASTQDWRPWCLNSLWHNILSFKIFHLLHFNPLSCVSNFLSTQLFGCSYLDEISSFSTLVSYLLHNSSLQKWHVLLITDPLVHNCLCLSPSFRETLD